MVERLPNIAAVFFDSEIPENVEIMGKLEDIDDDCDNNGIPFVKIEDVTKANDEYGLDSLPALLYWKNGRKLSLYFQVISAVNSCTTKILLIIVPSCTQ